MKIYFNASLAGKKVGYKRIIRVSETLGQQIITDHVMNRSFQKVNKQRQEEHERDFQIARKNIQESDAMITEADYPSIGVGLLVGLALDMYKPVLVLYHSMPHGLLLGDPDRLLTIKKYNPQDKKELKNIIKSFLRSAERKLLRYRFNFMINKFQNDYLEAISKKMGISRAKFIRDLIDKKIVGL